MGQRQQTCYYCYSGKPPEPIPGLTPRTVVASGPAHFAWALLAALAGGIAIVASIPDAVSYAKRQSLEAVTPLPAPPCPGS